MSRTTRKLPHDFGEERTIIYSDGEVETYNRYTWSHPKHWWMNKASKTSWDHWETVNPLTGKKGKGWHENTYKQKHLRKIVRRGGKEMIRETLRTMENDQYD